jgi:hypothetical protein
MTQPSPRAPLVPMRPLAPQRPYAPMQPLIPRQPLAPLRPGARRRSALDAPSYTAAPPYESATSFDEATTYQELPPPTGSQQPVIDLGLSQPSTSNWGGVPRPRPPVPLRKPWGNKGAGIVVGMFALLAVLGATGVFKSSSSETPGGSAPSSQVSIPPLSISGNGNHGSAQQSTKPAESHPTQRSGRTLSLNGTVSGERIRVTFLRFVNSAHSKDSFFGPSPGKRYFAAQFRITNTGSAQYVDSPANGARVIDSRGKSYRTTFLVGSLREGKVFDAAVRLEAGATEVGYLTFEIPKHAKVHQVQFAENSGFGQVGRWTFVRS